MKSTLLSTLVVGATFVACESSDVAIGERRADEAPAGASAPSPTETARDDGDLQLDVVTVRGGTTPLAGVLGVYWVQLLNRAPQAPPKLAYSAPFAGTEKRVSIPLSKLSLPDDPQLACKRACLDELQCPCEPGPRVGVAYILVVHDANGNGAPDLAFERVGDPAIGIATTYLAWSTEALPASASFPDGIRAGIEPYVVVSPDGGLFDSLGIPPPGTRFELRVCDTLDSEVCSPGGANFS